jgi:hypothetical protein
MLATPCAWGRIRVTVDLAITGIDKATAVPRGRDQENQGLVRRTPRSARGRVTRSVSK